MASRLGVSIRTAQRIWYVQAHCPELANAVRQGYKERKAGRPRGPFTWTRADRFVGTILKEYREGLRLEEIVFRVRSHYEAAPVAADFYEKCARQIVMHEAGAEAR
jgi:hypothetical protein